MILARITFGTRRKGDPEELENIAEGYLSSLYHSGQLCGEHFLTWINGRLNAHVPLAGRKATELRYHSPWGKRELKSVALIEK